MAAPRTLLLTPGPLNTSLETRQSCLVDYGSRDRAFNDLNTTIRASLLDIANGKNDYVCVPLQGSGTFAVEATLCTLLGRAAKILILINGQYGERMRTICTRAGRATAVLRVPENRTFTEDDVTACLASDSAITHMAVVHCETTTGIKNPIDMVARVAQAAGKKLIIDAMSSFGALEVDLQALACTAVVLSSNKCLEGIPGLGISLVRKADLAACEGNCTSLSLDLYDQWRNFESVGQWRFTPPTHVIAAFASALAQFVREGGQPARLARYEENKARQVARMKKMGFQLYLEESANAPIIVTYLCPEHNFVFSEFYSRLRDKDIVIYPGKLTGANTFRLGCIGQLYPADMDLAIDAIEAVKTDMGF